MGTNSDKHTAEKHIAAAIARLSKQATNDVKALRERAEKIGLTTLVAACDAELKSRPIEFSQEQADSFEAMAEQVKDLDLYAAIGHAFTKARLPSPEEEQIIRWMAANPGGSYEDARKAYGKGGLSLVIGHLVYDRYGCFKKFMKPGEDQSSVLISKDRSGGSVRYTLKPEVLAVFKEIGVI
ncbi:hypothetical protein [Microvirga alba]|uniref:Uncharacterized protein n=1 Tax=Microvirga alba TaxID=2791025 RepID=A0A931BRY7_9HYPH|nr:hypothetical protein [Microvirga alba]MBF9234609.1 hypothetical protein [Microvirga alba]